MCEQAFLNFQNLQRHMFGVTTTLAERTREEPKARVFCLMEEALDLPVLVDSPDRAKRLRHVVAADGADGFTHVLEASRLGLPAQLSPPPTTPARDRAGAGS